MNARFAHVFSRLSIVSVVAVSALGVAACSRAQTTDDSAAAEAKVAPSAEHRPGDKIFRQVEALDLRAEQRDSLAEVEQNLAADMAPHREAVRQVAQLLAAGIEEGQLDPAEAAAQQAALAVVIRDAKASFAGAMNEVHDLLDAGQRAALVTQLQAQHGFGGHGERARVERPDAPIAKLALDLGLSEEQKATLHDAVQKGVEEIFPDRKTRREAMEARMKALGAAFVSDDFDAADFDLGGGAEQALESFGEIATRAIDVSGRVLSASQRQIVAGMIRSRAERF